MREEKKQSTNTQKKPEPSQQQQNKNSSPTSQTKQECYPRCTWIIRLFFIFSVQYTSATFILSKYHEDNIISFLEISSGLPNINHPLNC